MVQSSNAHWVVWMSVLTALILSVMPMPVWLSVIRPLWVPMVVMYWSLALPERFGLVFAFIVGLIFDLFLNSLFGLHAMAMVLTAFFMLSLHRRLRMFPWWQQMFLVCIVTGFYQLLTVWVRSVTGQSQPSLWYLVPAISSALLWPWIYSILRFLRRYFRVT